MNNETVFQVRFCRVDIQIWEGSPCKMTFVLTCVNGRDTYEMRICRYPRGTAQILGKDLGDMLTELAGK